MELYQLKTFVAVAEEGNLTKAAERIFASQPAVSGHVKALEDELGLPLFVRTPRGMQLTEAGKGLRLKADTVLQAAEDMVNQARSYSKNLTGTLCVVLNTDPDFLRVTGLIDAMARTHPNVRLKFQQGDSWNVLKDVRDRRVDGGFSFSENHYGEVTSLCLKDIPIRIVAPASWAERVKGKTMHQLAALPWVKPNMECPYMRIIEGVLKDSGILLSDYIEVDTEDVIRQLVAAGKGLSLLKEHDADAMVAAGTAVLCDFGPSLSLPISFVYPKCRENDPLIRALSDAVVHSWADEN